MHTKTFLTSCLLACSIAVTPLCYSDNTKEFLSLTDMHLNPFTSCSSAPPCPAINELVNAPASQWGGILAKHDTVAPTSGQDSSYTMFESALTEAKKTAKSEHVRFVMILGDSLAHNNEKLYQLYTNDKSEAGYRAFVKKTMTFVASEINKTFADIDVYYTIGNNDSYVSDNVVEPKGQFLQDMAAIWSAPIKNLQNNFVMWRDFPTGGYYAVDLPGQPDLKLISMNSVLFYARATGKDLDQAAQQEFNWLHQQLQQAVNNKQKVILAMHVPPGINLFDSINQKPFSYIESFKTPYTQRLHAELQQFAANIVLISASHTHMDWFQELNYGGYRIPLVFSPAISPMFGNHPAFKVFSYDADLLHISNIKTYRYAIDSDHQWSLEYDFNQTYQPSCGQHCEIVNGMDSLSLSGELAESFKKYYGSGAYDVNHIMELWSPYYWCQTHTIVQDEYLDCLSRH